MDAKIMRTLSYGLYAIGVTDGTKRSACIVNTVFQITSEPKQIALSMNRENYSHDCIEKNGLFTVSVLSEDTAGTVIGALGYSSGKESDKLKNVQHKVLAEGVPVIKEDCCCWFLCKVKDQMETETHTVYLAEVIAGSEKIHGVPMTYDYYHKVIKGAAPKNAPTYEPPKQPENDFAGEKFICTVCGYHYVASNVAFEDLPEDWVCPVCGMPKKVFRRA